MNKIPIIGLPQVGLPLLIVKAQAKHLCFLLDTGSNINVLDKRVAEFFQLSGRTTQQAIENKSAGTVDAKYGMRRIPYPVEEYTENPVHLQAAIAAIGGKDNGGVRVWWDVKPLE